MTPCVPPSPDRAAVPPASEETSPPTGAPRRTLYGRRKGRGLKPAQEAALNHLLPALRVLLDGAPGRLDPKALFPFPVADLWLEIGFGGGEHLIAQAKAQPEIGLIGCEPFLEGVGKLARAIEAETLANIRIHPGDARDAIAALPEGALGRVFLLFPDPWPKARHHKRRFVAPETLDALARVLRPGAELRVATDWPDYVRAALSHVLRHPAFDWPATGPADWRTRPGDWPETRYERKALAAGRRPFYLRFVRR